MKKLINRLVVSKIRLIPSLSRSLMDRTFLLYVDLIATSIKSSKNSKNKPRLLWGSTPMINNKYWSNAMRSAGYESETVMLGFISSINKKNDFDRYFDQNLKGIKYYRFILDIIRNYDILHLSYDGFLPSGSKLIKKHEYSLFKKCGMKLIFLSYGADVYTYSSINNYSRRHALIGHYGKYGKAEARIKEKVNRGIQAGDCIVSMHMIEGLPYWDVFSFSPFTIDINEWNSEEDKHVSDGKNGKVTIVHSPNHRLIKGTEFIIKAIEELQEEGFNIEFILIEKKPNEEVKQCLAKADILVEQLLRGYGINAVEGMAMGAVVVSNLEGDEIPIKVFRRYSFLNECPAVSATPESIKTNLKKLIQNPALRKELGNAGRQYVVKYHSYKSAKFLFGKIYDKIWNGKEVDLINLYHPLRDDSYNNQSPLVNHPLKDNMLS